MQTANGAGLLSVPAQKGARNRMEQKNPCTCHIADSPHLKVIGLFIRIMRRHHACVERRLGDLGVHHSQHRMLVQLVKRQEDTPSQKELAEIMGISPAAVTTTLKRLEKEELITRSATDEDNRRNEIRITEKGLAKVMEGREIFETVDRAMFEGFSEAEMATLLDFMARIDRNLDAAGAPADLRCHPQPQPERKEESL